MVTYVLSFATGNKYPKPLWRLAAIEAVIWVLLASGCMFRELKKDLQKGEITYVLFGRVENIVGGQWYVTSAPTQTQRDGYRYAGEAFEGVLGQLRTLVENDLPALEADLEAAGAPYTPGRKLPDWSME